MEMLLSFGKAVKWLAAGWSVGMRFEAVVKEDVARAVILEWCREARSPRELIAAGSALTRQAITVHWS